MKHFLVFLTLIASVGAAEAQVPRKISYQGVLTDNSGNLVADGNYNFVFRVYNLAANGSALWTETQNNVPVSRGGFSVLLGNVTSLSLPFDTQYWLGISVNGGAELTPRVQLASSPYSVRADTTLAIHLPYAALVSLSAVPFMIQDNTGGVAAILGQTNSNSANSFGLRGVSGGSNPSSASAGVRGENLGTDSFSAGIWGSQNGLGRGVYGFAPGGWGVFGESTTGVGIYALSASGTGIFGQTNSTLANANAIQGLLSNSAGNGAAAIRGDAGSSSANTVGVWGQHNGGGTGVFGQCATGTGTSGNTSTGAGVWGSASTGVGVLGTSAAGGTAARFNSGSSTGTALEIQQGALKVTGGGIDTPTAAFVHVTNSVNDGAVCGLAFTKIDNPICNGDPTAILIVTPVENSVGQIVSHFAVAYCEPSWAIEDADGGSMPSGMIFNVLVIKTH